MAFSKIVAIPVLFILALAFTGGQVAAIDVFVDTFDDVNTGSCLDSECSLREAILYTNGLAGSDTIELPPGTYTLSLMGTGDDLGYVGDLDITDDVSIHGPYGETTIITAAGVGDRVFHIHSGPSVIFSYLEINGGQLNGIGGGILNEGQLSIWGCVIRDNRSYDSSGGNRGGGIFTTTGGILWLHESTVTGNWSGATGGGLYIEAGASTTIYQSTFSFNYGETGGGAAIAGFAGIENSTFSGNLSGHSGGGLYVSDTAELDSVTFSGNIAGVSGSAISSSGSIELTRSLIDGDCTGTGIVSHGFNLESPGNSCGLVATGDLPNQADAMLKPLAGYGGPTPTHALRENSPAIDTGFGCLTTDQRGFYRPNLIGCDAGAFEFGADPLGQWIFADGFESGDMEAWSTHSP